MKRGRCVCCDGSKKKPNLLLIVGGQSNSGTDADVNAQNTGRVAYSTMPAYLQTAPDNVTYVELDGIGGYTLEEWDVNSSLQWGYLNQTLHVLSQEYDNVMYSKRGAGGTTILPSSGGTYPRADFKGRANFAIAEANTMWGVRNYDIIVIWNLGETNGATELNAEVFETALTEWFAEIRADVTDSIIVYNKMGFLQDQDFPFIVSDIQPAQEAVALLDARNVIVRGESETRWELQDLTGDTSHYNALGAITLGNNFADAILTALDRDKVNNIAPQLVSCTISDANTSQIVLLYDKPLNNTITPFWSCFTIGSGRNVLTTTVSGSSVFLNLSERFYAAGSTDTLSYSRNTDIENSIQDFEGNRALDFTNIPIVSTITPLSISYSNRYTSNFTAGVDGWLGFSGGSVSKVDGIGGENDVLRVELTDNTPQAYKTSVFTGTIGHTYRIRFSIFVPYSYFIGGTPTPFSPNLTLGFGELIASMYPQIRSYAKGGSWVDLEYTKIAVGGGTQLVFQGVGVVGQSFYLKNVVVDRII